MGGSETNDNQHNACLHNNDTRHNTTFGVKTKPSMLSVIMPSVVLLNVVAPWECLHVFHVCGWYSSLYFREDKKVIHFLKNMRLQVKPIDIRLV
jgi:hypothetical protein